MAWDVTAQSWTSAELVSDVRRVASLPVTSTDFTDLIILREATDVLWSFAGWAMSQAGDGRLVELLQRPVSGLLTSDYRTGGECELPPLAIADTVESVVWLNAAGSSETRLARIDASQQSTYDDPGRTGSPAGYTLLGSRLRLFPKPDQGGIVRLTYQRRHPMLVPDTAANVGTLTLATTLDTVGTLSWNTPISPLPSTGDTIDLINPAVPYRFAATGLPVTSANLSQVFVTVTPGLFTGLNMQGARVVRPGTSPYVHYPLELRTAVTEKTAANLMRRYGDLTNAQASEQTAIGELNRVMQLLSPRSKRDRPRAVNPWSPLRAQLRRGGWWR